MYFYLFVVFLVIYLCISSFPPPFINLSYSHNHTFILLHILSKKSSILAKFVCFFQYYRRAENPLSSVGTIAPLDTLLVAEGIDVRCRVKTLHSMPINRLPDFLTLLIFHIHGNSNVIKIMNGTFKCHTIH